MLRTAAESLSEEQLVLMGWHIGQGSLRSRTNRINVYCKGDHKIILH